MKTSEELLKFYLPLIEAELEKLLPNETDGDERNILFSAMRYAVLDGGKRIRPILLLEFCRLCGGDIKKALPFACAIEMIHSYSLVHDDLPCMDDDDFRRGKLSTHKKYDEATALLAGDALLTNAFSVMLGSDADCQSALKAAKCLADAAGCIGMIGGQVIDLQSEGKECSIETLRKMDDGKTVALISAACEMGCILANAEQYVSVARQYAENLGLAFQIQDDILDVIGDADVLGKPIGSDDENKKSNYVSLLGLEQAMEMVRDLTCKAVESMEIFGEDAQALIDLAKELSVRTK